MTAAEQELVALGRELDRSAHELPAPPKELQPTPPTAARPRRQTTPLPPLGPFWTKALAWIRGGAVYGQV